MTGNGSTSTEKKLDVLFVKMEIKIQKILVLIEHS